MSRIVVKNLPKAINEEQLRKLFGQKGTITDVQLKYTKDGKFRQFAFIGFKEEHEARESMGHFNNTYIATNKIDVEECAALGDKKPKPWSKYSSENIIKNKKEVNEDALYNKKKNKAAQCDEPSEKQKLLEKYRNDPLFKEYVDVHPNMKEMIKDDLESGHQSSKNFQGHEDSGIQSSEKDESETDEEEGKIADKEISDLEYMKQLQAGANKKKKEKVEKEKINLFTVKLKGLPYNCKKKDIKSFFKPNTPYSIRVPRKIHGIAYAGFRTEKKLKKALLKDRSFISGKQISVMKYEYNDNLSANITSEETDTKKVKWRNQEELLKNEEDIGESGRIFVRNLAYTVTEDDIEKLFSQYGPLTEVNLPIDSTSRKMKGFGTITFLMPEHAVRAYTELDGTVFQGRMLHLLPGKSKDTDVGNGDEGDSTNYKTKKQAKLKSQAGSSYNWNSLFLGHDAVAGVIADTYGKSKEEVLAPHGDGSAAVRLALGETQIIAETRKYLENEGVMLDAFSNNPVQRSKRILLVKNLPSKTEVKELRDIFEKHGVVSRIVLPPSGITAIVEFEEPAEARKAYLKVAYSKFKHVPLFLEWAPEACLSHKAPSNQSKPAPENDVETLTESFKDAQSVEKGKTVEESTIEKVLQDDEEDEEPEPDTTLFVKNLNFQTIDEDLRKHFEVCGKVNYATVATKKDKNDPSNRLSMGYGFVRFYHKTSAEKALKTLQQSSLDGKSLELKRSERTLQSDTVGQKKTAKRTKQTGSKIMVKNIPFQANRKELMELFSVFGEIKSLRLPKKMSLDTDSHRGFGFVDFVTAADAKNAFEALSQSTHLYGRRLVLEWASADESVEQIRKRTADHFKPSEEVRSKKSVFSLEVEEES